MSSRERVSAAIEVRKLILAGWRQTSARHRLLGWADGDPDAPGADYKRRMGRHKRQLTDAEFGLYKVLYRLSRPARRLRVAAPRCACGRFLLMLPSRKPHPRGFAIAYRTKQCFVHGEQWIPYTGHRVIASVGLPVPGP